MDAPDAPNDRWRGTRRFCAVRGVERDRLAQAVGDFEDADRLRAFLLAEGSWSEFAELAQAGRQDDAAELMQARRSLAADWLPLSVR